MAQVDALHYSALLLRMCLDRSMRMCSSSVPGGAWIRLPSRLTVTPACPVEPQLLSERTVNTPDIRHSNLSWAVLKLKAA